MANFNELLNAAKGWADLAGKKANEAVEISKLQINNAKLNGELQKAYEKLGAFVYKMEKEDECNEELIKMCVADHPYAFHCFYLLSHCRIRFYFIIALMLLAFFSACDIIVEIL